MRLDPARPYKPLDVGNGLVAASVDARGRLLSIATYDAEHGLVLLTDQKPFDETRRYDQAYVRAYRAALASAERSGWGQSVDLESAPVVELVDGHIPRTTLQRGALRVEVTTLAPEGRRAVVQRWAIENASGEASAVGLRWVDPRVMRAPYPQLTEGGPLSPATAQVAFQALRATVPTLEIDPHSTAEWHVVVAIGERPEEALGAGASPPLGAPSFAARRALTYARICALRVPPDAVCILADHQILPLSWNRDAYFVATLLRQSGERETVRAHLRWLFRVADRRAGTWGRSHLANGRMKDRAFQLDQQCYPLLEAAECGEAGTYASEIAETLRELERRRVGDLYPTEETPADDPLRLPFHFSSHVLLWRTLTALRDAGFKCDPEPLRQATLRAFENMGRFAYATDAQGGFRHYHDANDVPTALAPAWGFCSADDPRWRNTVAFAWSEANEAYYAGPLGGLGSLHTPHPWPLGDLQEIIVARAMGDPAREERAREKLARVSTWDGLLPEAYDEASGVVRSRHWFAWPVALRANLNG